MKPHETGWDANSLTLLFAVALAPPLAVEIAMRGASVLTTLALGVAVAVAWQLLFAWIRGRPKAWDGLVTALIFTALVPASVPMWQLVLALSFGLVMGDLIFGGRGRGFLSPAAVGLAFLLFSFSQPGSADLGLAASLAALSAGVLLLAVGVLSWRVVVGFAVALIGLSAPWSDAGLAVTLPAAPLLLGLVFLVGDPVGAASTNLGRWVYGFLAGALVVVLGQSGSDTLSAVVFAALLAGIFAPLIDQGVIWLNTRRRARRRHHV